MVQENVGRSAETGKKHGALLGSGRQAQHGSVRRKEQRGVVGFVLQHSNQSLSIGVARHGGQEGGEVAVAVVGTQQIIVRGT